MCMATLTQLLPDLRYVSINIVHRRVDTLPYLIPQLLYCNYSRTVLKQHRQGIGQSYGEVYKLFIAQQQAFLWVEAELVKFIKDLSLPTHGCPLKVHVNTC